MENNCLVTKLKSVVNNDTLNFLGCIKVNIDAPSSSVISFQFKYTKASELRIVGNGYFTNRQGANLGKTLACTANTDIYPQLSTGSYTFLVPKEGLIRFTVISSNTYNVPIELEQLEYCNQLTLFQPTTAVVSGDISKLMYSLPELKSVIISGVNSSSEIRGNFNKSVGNCTSIDFQGNGYLIRGDINNFKNWIGSSTTFKWKSTRINGELSTLFDYIAEHGTISTMTILPNNVTTLNGVTTTETQKTVTFSGGSWTISE